MNSEPDVVERLTPPRWVKLAKPKLRLELKHVSRDSILERKFDRQRTFDNYNRGDSVGWLLRRLPRNAIDAVLKRDTKDGSTQREPSCSADESRAQIPGADTMNC